MRLRAFPFLCTIAVTTAAGTIRAQGTAHQNPDYCYTIEVPEGWSAESGELSNGMRGVWLSWISNTTPAVAVVPGWIDLGTLEPRKPGGTSTASFRNEAPWEAADRLLAPGNVAICMSIEWGLAPFVEPFARHRSEYPENRIEEFLNAPVPEYESGNVVTFQIWARRWGEEWHICLHCRKPFQEADLQKAFAAMRTLSFPAAPVTFKEQAAELVIQSLPVDSMYDFDSMDCVIGDDYENWSFEESADGFQVTYTQLDGTEARHPLRAYQYFVGRDAHVVLVTQSTGKFPK
jgi:hypothetical protein